MSGAPSKYCKALLMKDLRQFAPLDRAARGQHTPLNDDAIVYIHDNYVVREGILPENAAIFDDISEEWKSFCQEKLGFAIPDFQRQTMAAEQGA